ncbi:MAG: ABC transporter substrate-binding protein, partial [Chitinophagaceae bacterium]|nr:ABC transporter substrate-binding protein [Rubrivivax sp.]
MNNRRTVLKTAGAVGVAAAAQSYLGLPALAQNRPVRIGIIAPKAGIAGTIGECGLRGTMFATERINADGGIAGRKVELVVEEETNPKDSIERLRKLVLQDKVDCVQGIVSSGVSLAMGAVAEEMKALLKKFGVEHKVVADQWPKVGTLDLTSHVAALKAAKPDLVFSSL